METYGPEDRALFETAATQLFEEIIAKGGISTQDPRIVAGGDLEEAFALLRRLNLVNRDPAADTWQGVDPTTVQSRVVAPLGQRGADLLVESSSWAKAFGVLDHAWRRATHSPSHGPFTYVHAEAIDPFLAGLVADCEEEMLTAQPQAGRDPRKLALAALRDTNLLERGATIRTLYQHSARRSSVTRKYVAAVTDRGAEVRTLDEFFNRMIVIDRRVAVIPSGEDLSVALAVREPSVVAYLVDVFERSWERARPFTSSETTLMKDIAAEQRAMTLRMLIEGHSDPVSAKRLGVSPRTYAGYVADLKAEFEAETRFQLGYVIGQQGISGSESTDPGDG
ncbi:LuxR family transcriptional regulator [Nocardioides sp. MAHUQ-72]